MHTQGQPDCTLPWLAASDASPAVENVSRYIVRTVPIEIPLTARLQREAERWKSAPRPDNIVAPGPGQRSVWDFPRPPAVERVCERVTVEFAGRCIADTRRCLRVCETASPPTYYIPMDDVAMQYLREGTGASLCEWKGMSRCYDIAVLGAVSLQAAWTYPSVQHEYAVLANHMGFYASRVDRCTVGNEIARPQPGGFYAGWITSDLTGPWKGEIGTGGW